MARLIDADALCEDFKERQRAALRWKEKAILDGDEERQIRADATLTFLSEVKLTIDNAPTVEERPRGEWIKVDRPYGGFGDHVLMIECSKCHTELVYHGKEPKFCLECGADMREADDDKVD